MPVKSSSPRSAVLRAAAFVLALTLPGFAHAQKPDYMIEVLTLKPGATVAEAYFKSVYPIIASHGLYPVNAYQVVENGAQGQPKIVQIWRVENPQGFPEIMADENYRQHIETRDSIFDLKTGRIGYMGAELY